MTKANSWTITVEENPDNPEELVMPLPQDLLTAVGWKEGDILDWHDNKNGTWMLSKKVEVADGNDF